MLTKEENQKIASLLKQTTLFVEIKQNTSLTFEDEVNTMLEHFSELDNEITTLKLLINGLNSMLLRPIEKEIGYEVYKSKELFKDDPYDFRLFAIEKRKEFVEEKLLILNNVLEKKLILNNSNSKEDSLKPDLNTLQSRTKIILLQELGVLDFLKKKEPFKNNTHLAKMIAELIAGKDEDVTAVYNTVRTDLSYVIHRNNPKTPYTKKQIKKVNSILATFSLPQIK